MIRKAAYSILSAGPVSPRGEYQPYTLAIQSAALKLAAQLIREPALDGAATLWQASIEKWTLSKGLIYSSANTSSGNMNSEEETGQNEGFLELVRLGVRGAEDPRVIATLNAYTSSLSQNRFRPVHAGELGHYSVATGDLEEARRNLQVLEEAALATGLIPEQIANLKERRVGLGVACPLVWAHAEGILLHRSILEGSVFDAPRYR